MVRDGKPTGARGTRRACRPGRTASRTPVGSCDEVLTSLRKDRSGAALMGLRDEPSLPLPPVGSTRDVGWRGGLWTGRLAALSARFPGPRERLLEILGKRRDDVDGHARARVRERQPRRVQELAPQPVQALVAVVGVAADGVAD